LKKVYIFKSDYYMETDKSKKHFNQLQFYTQKAAESNKLTCKVQQDFFPRMD